MEQCDVRVRTRIVGSGPMIVCLCGSTRFGEAFRKAQLEETLAGRIVLTVGCHWHSDEALGLSAEVKERLDELHLRKIDLADEAVGRTAGEKGGDRWRLT